MFIDIGLKFYRNYAKFAFYPFICELVHGGIIVSEDVKIGDQMNWVETTDVVVDSFAVGCTMFVIRSHFLDDLLQVSKNYEF